MLVAICFGMFAALVSAERVTSPTSDEHLHLTRGLAWWWGGDTRLNWPHPPLGQLVAAAPVALLHEPVPIDQLRGYETANMKNAALDYFEDYDTARSQLTTARRSMMFLALLLAIYLYEWTRRRYGPRLAGMVTLLYAADPVLLAHAGLMTTDFPVTFVTVFALLQLHDYLLGRSAWRVAGLVLSIGALVIVKLTGIVVALLLLPPAIWFAVRGRGRFEGLDGKRRGLFLARDMMLAMLMGFFSINAVYKFHETGLTPQEIVAHPVPSLRLKKEMSRDDLVVRMWPEGVPIPLPFTYLYSAQFVKEQNARGHAGYFLGKRRPKGTPGYFPIMLGAKLPSGMILLLLVGLVLAARRRFSGLTLDVWLHGYFVVAYLVLSFNSQINIGVRHALLVVPSLSILAARSANALWASGRGGRWFATGCLAAAVVGTLVAYPRFIGDFNWFVGGRSGGHWISIIGEDWGQDLNELAGWQKRQGVPVSYFAQNEIRYSELEHLGAEVHRFQCYLKPPEGHWLAFHITPRVRENRCILRYAHRKPDLVLNDHILLFRPRTEKARP